MKKKILCVVTLGIIIFIIYSLILFEQSQNDLMVSYYNIQTDKLDEDIRIVQISDLHNSVFGEENELLIKEIIYQDPDIILVTGDLLNSDDENLEIAISLLKELVDICPVYVSLGNHEVDYIQNYDTDLVKLYGDTDAIVLDKEYIDININNSELRIGGIYGYCLPDNYYDSMQYSIEESKYLNDLQSTDRYIILMCHMPACWLLNNGLNEWNVDCVFAGHVHGGQIIFFNGSGLYAPDFGWFPGKLSGVFQSDDYSKSLILSRGLGSNEKIPRYNNVPEIVVADIQGGKKE